MPHTIAIDWGTTRLRGFLLDANGAVLGRVSRPDGGMQSVAAGGFAAALQDCVGVWLTAHPELPVVMAGMVGSRNGWFEAPYAKTPASAADLAGQIIRVKRADGGIASIIPGVSNVNDWGTDVMRGEETLVFGCSRKDAVIVLPGTHSKWVDLKAGKIKRFATYMTGEIYALLKSQSILGRLALEPEDLTGFARGLAAAKSKSVLTHQLFKARSEVLIGALEAEQVAPYLSGLLIGTEILGAKLLFGTMASVVLVADGQMAAIYGQALKFFDMNFQLISPETALINGLNAIRKEF